MSSRTMRRTPLQAFLGIVERGGNALPHPATLFLLLGLGVILLSAVTAQAGLEALHPKTGELIRPVSLLSLHGLHRILTETVKNFTGFAPLGTVLVAMLGIGVAEGTGLLGASMRALVLSAPRRMLTPVVVFAGVMSNVGSEIGYVLLVPLAATIFQAAGRNPLLGLAGAFAGVSGGYSANLLLGSVDPLLAGLTQEAARIFEPGAVVSPACNYYFMFASTFLVTGLGWWVTEKLVAPRLGSGAAAADANAGKITPLAENEKRGLRFAALAIALLAAGILWGTVPGDGFLRDPSTGELLHSPFMSGIVSLIFLTGVVLGLAYGLGARTVRKDADLLRGMSKAMETLGGYLVLVFFAAQFVAYFGWSNLGLILAVKGAALLQSLGLTGVPLLLAFIALTAFLNLFMGSASAKWAIMAPVFVPMFALLGYSPELTQCAFRVGDSCTNIISPMMTYFPLIIAFYQRYDQGAGIGSLVATMLPYSIVFLIGWSIFFAIWVSLGIPLGPS
ncbi:MAG: AbgT family transporter [Planctomycetota bacterium]